MERGALTLAIMWMDPENTMLIERSRDTGHTECDSIDGKHPEQADPQTQSGILVVRDQQEGDCWMGTGFFLSDQMSWTDTVMAGHKRPEL